VRNGFADCVAILLTRPDVDAFVLVDGASIARLASDHPAVLDIVETFFALSDIMQLIVKDDAQELPKTRDIALLVDPRSGLSLVQFAASMGKPATLAALCAVAGADAFSCVGPGSMKGSILHFACTVNTTHQLADNSGRQQHMQPLDCQVLQLCMCNQCVCVCLLFLVTRGRPHCLRAHHLGREQDPRVCQCDK
jgi:hypothetical protein